MKDGLKTAQNLGTGKIAGEAKEAEEAKEVKQLEEVEEAKRLPSARQDSKIGTYKPGRGRRNLNPDPEPSGFGRKSKRGSDDPRLSYTSAPCRMLVPFR